MIKQLVFISLILFIQNARATVIVNSDTISISGVSAKSDDSLTLFGGIAGATQPVTGDSISTADTCDQSSGTIKACNPQSVYASLKLSIAFKVSQSVTSAKAKIFLESGSGSYTELSGSTQTVSASANSSTITLETTWSVICTNAGLSASCDASGSTPLFSSKGLKFGVDADADGEVEDDERKQLTVKLHHIPVGFDPTQSYCASTAAGAGICNIVFAAGDAKAFIDSAIYGGADSTSGSLDWQNIAIFPIPVTTGSEAAAYTGFLNGSVEPILKTLELDGSIPDSQVTGGGIENYQKYCMVYASQNAAKNIYKFVIGDGTNIAAMIAGNSCVTPSEVVGVLDDKHCFISTAAFGSESAPEVEIFRQFRNRFLAPNFFGRIFVKTYYKVSPGVADVISGNETLKFLTRVVLYPFLVFSMLSLKIGFLLSLLVMGALLLAVVRIKKHVRLRPAAALMLILFFSADLKAEIVPQEKKISHPQQQDGLVRITQDGSYIYDTYRPLKSESSSFSIGQANHPVISIQIESVDPLTGLPDGGVQNLEFEDFYHENSGLTLGYNYQKFPWINQGKLGYEIGLSAMIVTGNGRLVATPAVESKESFTFVTMPITLGAVYRLEWKDRQMFAPYASGGATYVALIEKREDKAAPNFAGGFGYYGTAGVLFNLSSFDADSGFQLESEYGISNMWLSAEFKVIEVNAESFEFSNAYVNAGLFFDF